MAFTKSCPGSRTIREPIPEYLNCSNCGREVEIWTDELKATCPSCGTRVFREQQPSCIDWCPYAQECIGPEVYQRLRPREEESPETSGPLDIVRREHQKALDQLGRLRGASLCLRLSAAKPNSPVRDKGTGYLAEVLDFFDKELRRHFRGEEEILFPALEKHIGPEKSPTQLLLKEHIDVWRWYDRLREKLAELQHKGQGATTIPTKIQDITGHLAPLLQAHIKKENESLLPLAQSLLGEKELATISERWQKLGEG